MGYGKKIQEQKKDDVIFQTRNSISAGAMKDLNAPQDMREIKRSNSIGGLSQEKKDASWENVIQKQSRENKEYLKKIIESANNRKLASRVNDQLEHENLGDDWKEVRRAAFHQQYPEAKKDRFFGSSENELISKAKKIFRNADLNTVREKPALDQFFADKKFTDGPVGENAKDEMFNKELNDYVNFLLTAHLDSTSLTDAYLADHIAEIYEFSWKLSKYQELKQNYPVFFESIPEAKKILIERMYASSDDLSSLLENHLRLHGIVIQENEELDGTFSTRTEYRIEVSDKTERHEKRRQLKEDYDRQYNDFMQKAFANKEYELARQFAKNKSVNESRDLYDALKKQVPEDSDTAKHFGAQISFVMKEIEKTLSLKDQLVAEQNANVDKMDNDNGEEEGFLRTAIKRTNDKLILCTEHIDNYKQYLFFLNGSIDVLPKDVVDFLKRGKQDELLEPVRFKTQLQCAEEALDLRDEIDKVQVEGEKDKAPVSRDKFLEKWSIYQEGKKKAAEYDKLTEQWKEKCEEIKKRADKYAELAHLQPAQTRFYRNFMDPQSSFLSDDDLFWIYLAGEYEPTDATDEEVRKKIIEKGIKPWLDTFLDMDPQNCDEIRLSKDDDFDSKDYWEKHSKVLLGYDMKSILDVLRNYGQELSDEEFLKLRSIGVTMQGFTPEVLYLDGKIKLPMARVFGSDDNLMAKADKVQDLLFKTGSLENNEKVSKLRDKYSAHKTGIRFDGDELIQGQRANNLDPSDFVEIMLRPMADINKSALSRNADLKAEYDKNFQIVKNDRYYRYELHDSAVAAEEARLSETGYEPMTKEQIEKRLQLKKRKSFNETLINSKWKREFKEAFGGRTDGAANLELFKMTLHYVEKDANGAVKSEYREKYLQNRQDISDYIAGGERRQEYLKRKVKQIISFEFTEDMLKPEYISTHFTEILEMNRLMNGFYHIAAENEEFLNSDAFTEQERAEFNLKFTENTIPATLSQVLESYAGTLGMHTSGEELDMFPLEKNELKNEQSSRQQKYKAMLDTLLQKTLSDDIKSYRKHEWMMNNQPQLIKSISDLERKTKETAPDDISLVRELKDYLYGKKDKLSKKAILLAKSNGFEEYTKEAEVQAEREASEEHFRKLDIKAYTTPREERGVYETDINDEVREHAWMDRETAKRVALIDKRLAYNDERILDSDRLYDTLVSEGEKKIEKLSTGILGRIKVYTNRLLSLKFDDKTLTEEYIVEHIDEFYEYSRAYHLLDYMMEELPGTLRFLSDFERNRINGRKGYISEVDQLLTLVMKKHGMKILAFDKSDKPEHWSGFMINSWFNEPTEEEKSQIEKEIKKLTDTIKAIDAENDIKAKENFVTNKVAGDAIEKFDTNKVAGDRLFMGVNVAIKAENLVTNRVAGDAIFRDEKEAAEEENLVTNKVAGDEIFQGVNETIKAENLVTNKVAGDTAFREITAEEKVEKLESDFEDQIKEINLNFKSDTLTASSENYEDYAEEIRELLIKKERMYRHFLKGDALKRKIAENRGRLESLKTGPVQAMSETIVETTAEKKEYTPKVTEDQKKGAKYDLSAYPELDEKNKVKIPLDPNKLEEYLGEDVLTDKLEAQYVGFTTAQMPELPKFNADPKEKAELKKTIRDHLLLEQGALIDDRRMRTKKAALGMNEKYVDDLTHGELYGQYGTKAEYKNVVREILFTKDVFDGKNTATGNIWMINELGHIVKETVIKPLEALDLKTFIIADDAQFVAGFGARYDLLTKIDAYETLLDLYDKESAVISGGADKSAARAKLAILKQIKQSYEERMELISSPYYTALSTEYLDSFMGKEGENKLKDEGLDASVKDYIQLYRKIHNDKLTPKVIDNRYKLKLSGVRKETAGKDMAAIYEKYLHGVNPEGSNEEILTEIYSDHKKAEMDAFAKDDIEFLRTQEIRFASDTLNLSGNDFMEFHNDFADILTKGTFRGTRLDEKVRSKISGYIHSYVVEIKELEAAHRIRDVLTQMTVFSCGADTNNPEFANSFIGKMILRLKNCEEEESVNEKIAADRSTHLVNTFGPKGVLLTIFETLIDAGVPIGEKYAERARDPEVRKDILDTEKNANDYPPILVNGREYLTYSQPPVLMKIDGLNIKMKTADAEKLDTLVRNIEQCYQDNTVIQSVYDGGGDKAILFRIERRKIGEMIRNYTMELEALLKKYKVDISGEKEVPAKYRITHEEFERRTVKRNENKLPDSHENLDKTVNDLKEAGKHEPRNLDEIYAAIDSEYADSGLSAEKIQTIKDRQRDFFDFDESIRSNADPELIKALEKDKSLDSIEITYLLYPVDMHLVNVDDEGKELLEVNKYARLPLTKEDEINLSTNNELLESLQSKKLSDRQEFLDHVADEAGKLAFTYKQLHDPKYIVNHKEQAIRHLSFFRNLLKLYKSHAGYYLSKERADSNKMLFNLLVKTDYVNYSSYCIQRALLSDRMRKDGTLSGTHAKGLEAPDTLASAYANGKNKVGKADLTDVEFAALKEKYGSKKQSFTISERESLIKSVLDDMEKEKKNKGNKQNDKVWAEIDKYKKSLIKGGVLYHSDLENDLDLISYTGSMTADEIREEKEREEQERKEQERKEQERKKIEKELEEIRKKASKKEQKKPEEEQKKPEEEQKKPEEEQKKAEEKKADIKEKKNEKKFLPDGSPEILKNLEAERKLYNSADYPEETKKRYEALLKEKKFAVPKDMADLISIRGSHMEPKYFNKRNSKGEIYVSEDYFWKEDTDPVFKEAYDWLVGYYRANMDNYKDLKPIPYNKQASAPLKGVHTPYEDQGGSLYCWACTMNGLMNEYAGRKVSDLNMVKKTPLNIPSFEESGFIDRAKYDEGVKMAERMHKGDETGNPAIFGDYILQKLPDTAVCGAHIGIDPKRREFCKRRFLETLGTRLEKGPVGLLYAGHFVLVYAIDGDKLKVRDSNADDPDQLEDYKYDADYIFSTNYREVELVWLENVKGREQEIAREFSLEYDEENRTFSGVVNREKETILHKNGIEGMKANANGDLVTYQIYVPKQLSGNQGPDGGERPGQQTVEHVAQPQQAVEGVSQAQPQQQENLVSNKVAADAIFKEEKEAADKEEAELGFTMERQEVLDQLLSTTATVWEEGSELLNKQAKQAELNRQMDSEYERIMSRHEVQSKKSRKDAGNNPVKRTADEEIALAERYVERDDIYSEDNTTVLTEEIADHAAHYASWGYGIQESYREYRKALDIRNRFLKTAETYLNEYRSAKGSDKKRISGKIAENNRKIVLISAHANSYRYILCYLSGITGVVPEEAGDFLRRENRTDILDILNAKMMNEGEVAEKEFRDLENELQKKNEDAYRIDSQRSVIKDIWEEKDALKDQIKKNRNAFAKPYLKLSKAEKEELREKTVYVHEKKTPEEVNKSIALGPAQKNKMKSVGEVMRKMMPEAYKNIDRIRTSEDEAERTTDLVHSLGNRFLKEGHDVIEFDIGGSGYREFLRTHNGFYGKGGQDEETMQVQYGRKYNETHPDQPELVREKVTKGKGKYKDRKKYRYTIAGPSPEGTTSVLPTGLANAGPYSIRETMYRICDITMERLTPIFESWKLVDKDLNPANGTEGSDHHHTIDLMFRGHSRGGVGAVLGAEKVKYWIHKKYPAYEKYVRFHLIQYDPVPGGLSDHGGVDKVKHDDKGLHHTRYTKYLRPLGESADTTVIYSMNTDHTKFFTPQQVKGAKRVILTPFNHTVGQDHYQADASQIKDDTEKMHAMPFIDARDGKVYRQSGLNELPEGLYIIDEQNILVRIERIEDFIRIMQATAPMDQQNDRKEVLLNVVASKLGVKQKDAKRLWSQMLKENSRSSGQLP